VVYSKLGRDRVWGWCHADHIEIDERLKGKKRMEICLHECLHFLFPDADEDEIERKSILLTNTVWYEGYRRIDNDNSQRLQDGKK
jgi:hypothetical protein